MPPYDLSKVLVVGISSRALFDLEKEIEIFDTQGLEAYTAYQIDLWSKIQSLRNGAEDGDE
jgi:5'-nucleotidase